MTGLGVRVGVEQHVSWGVHCTREFVLIFCASLFQALVSLPVALFLRVHFGSKVKSNFPFADNSSALHMAAHDNNSIALEFLLKSKVRI